MTETGSSGADPSEDRSSPPDREEQAVRERQPVTVRQSNMIGVTLGRAVIGSSNFGVSR